MSTDTPILIPSGSVLELAFGTEVRGQVMKHVDDYFDAANAASRKFGELVREAQMAEIAAARLFRCANNEAQRARALGILHDDDWCGRVSPSELTPYTVTLGEKLNAARCPESVQPKPEVITDLGAHWNSLIDRHVTQGERLSVEVKTCPEAVQALKEATEQATAAVKRVKEAQANLVRTIEMFGSKGVQV